MNRLLTGKAKLLTGSKALPHMGDSPKAVGASVKLNIEAKVSRKDARFHNAGELPTGQTVISHGNDEKSITIRHDK